MICTIEPMDVVTVLGWLCGLFVGLVLIFMALLAAFTRNEKTSL